MTNFDDNVDDDDEDSEYMDHGVPYVLRVLYDRFWDDPETVKPSKNKYDGSRTAFLFWLHENFEQLDRKQLCHEAEVEPRVCDQLADMLDNYTGQDIILTLWPIYTMAAREEPTKRVKAITVNVGYCFEDNTVSIMQSQTICERSDPEDTTPLDDSSVLLAVSSTIDSMMTTMAQKGVDAMYKINNISVSSAYLAYTLFGKTSAMFKDRMAKNLVFLQQFIAGTFAPATDIESAFTALDEDSDEGVARLKKEIADAISDYNDEIEDLFDE